MTEPRFIGECVEVHADDMDGPPAIGEPAIPRRFVWRDDTVEVARVLRSWKEYKADTHKSGQQYVRKHWYEVATRDGRTMKLYFDRQPRSASQHKRRWWLFSVAESE